MRGVLALMVAASHVSGSIWGWGKGQPFRDAYLAVDAFFIISGFVLTYAFGAKIADRRIAYGRFFLQRVARLWPMHMLALGLTFLVYLANLRMGRWNPAIHIDAASTAVNLLLMQNVGIWDKPFLNDPSWSISVELWVSALVLVAAARLSARVSLGLAAVSYAVLAARVGSLEIAGNLWPWVNGGILRGVAGILLGSALYRCLPAQDEPGRGRLAEAAVAALGVLLPVQIAGDHVGLRDFLFVAGFAGAVMLLWSAAPRRSIAVLSSPPLRFLGAISYALYLTHTAVIIAVQPSQWIHLIGHRGVFVATIALAVLVGAAAHLLFERPVHDWLRGRLSPAVSRP